jgi:hypothetical protein
MGPLEDDGRILHFSFFAEFARNQIQIQTISDLRGIMVKGEVGEPASVQHPPATREHFSRSSGEPRVLLYAVWV